MAVRAVIFDFDGLIVDTESPHLEAWREVFDAHGAELTFEAWAACIGTSGAFDPAEHLEQLLGRSFDRASIRRRTHARYLELLASAEPREGIVDWITGAQRAGLPLGVASNSSRRWVADGLARVGLVERFEVIVGCDDVGGRGKPAPDVYLEAVRRLGADPDVALAVEDSPHGVRSAKDAGLWCVAVPNDLTRGMDLGAADLVVRSAAEISFAEACALVVPA
jgi:HAD superfamily hydrolase (TIGR01509 family)